MNISSKPLHEKKIHRKKTSFKEGPPFLTWTQANNNVCSVSVCMTSLELYTVIREQCLSREFSDEHKQKIMCHVSNSQKTFKF